MYKSILVPVDLCHDAVAPRTLAVARLLAGGHGRITLLTVVEPAPAYVMAQVSEEVLAANREHTRTALDALAAREGFPGQAQIRNGAGSTTVRRVIRPWPPARRRATARMRGATASWLRSTGTRMDLYMFDPPG